MTRISCCVSLLRLCCESHAIFYRSYNPPSFQKKTFNIFMEKRKWQLQLFLFTTTSHMYEYESMYFSTTFFNTTHAEKILNSSNLSTTNCFPITKIILHIIPKHKSYITKKWQGPEYISLHAADFCATTTIILILESKKYSDNQINNYYVKKDVLFAFMTCLCGFNICISKCYFLFVTTDEKMCNLNTFNLHHYKEYKLVEINVIPRIYLIFYTKDWTANIMRDQASHWGWKKVIWWCVVISL